MRRCQKAKPRQEGGKTCQPGRLAALPVQEIDSIKGVSTCHGRIPHQNSLRSLLLLISLFRRASTVPDTNPNETIPLLDIRKQFESALIQLEEKIRRFHIWCILPLVSSKIISSIQSLIGISKVSESSLGIAYTLSIFHGVFTPLPNPQPITA
jgi:hypothetical protein